jgi:TRAP-type C4-dicarboxylate transport system permease large subunit
VLLLLLLTVTYGTLQASHSRLQQVGESLWEGYFEMRVDPVEPSCDPNASLEASPVAPGAAEEEEAAVDDLFDDDENEDESEAESGELREPNALDASDEESVDDLFDDDDEESAGDAAASARVAMEAAREECRGMHARFESATARITSGVRMYRAFETSVARVVEIGDSHSVHLLVLLMLVAGLVATARRDHIALRPAHTRFEHRFRAGGQVVVQAMLLSSSYTLWRIDVETGVTLRIELHYLWMAGFGLMMLQSLWNFFRLPEGAPAGGTLLRALPTLPLYAIMALISGSYFFLVEDHPAGLAIFLTKLTEFRMLYLAVGLYVLVGMLLKQTRVAGLFFNILRPWKFPPEILAFVIVFLAAVPTAYSGASGIFVIAAGGVVYRELSRAGARGHLALAATAMSGSLGVVLRPCLLVVIVAALNKQVTTDELFAEGGRVYMLTSVLFLVGCKLSGSSKFSIAPVREAWRASLGAFGPLLPYGLIAVAVWAFYEVGLQTHFNEHTAPIILPAMLLAMLVHDRIQACRDVEEEGEKSAEQVAGYRESCICATSETASHAGALLMLMGLSACLGGVVERAELMSMIPQDFGSPEATMGMLVVVLVIIGMTMDPYGAVILVSASIAGIAYENGIDPVHFWMVVLVAFELGYLSPPVALNHLLARQVVGEAAFAAAEAEAEGGNFWRRNERILLPLSVMAVALVLVAFGPLIMAG